MAIASWSSWTVCVAHCHPWCPGGALDLPDLLDIHDDGDDDQEMPDLAQAMEQEFFMLPRMQSLRRRNVIQ